MRHLVPVSLIVGLLVLLGIGLRLDPTEVPSPLIGKLAPPFDLPTLEDDGRVTSDVLLGQPTLVNFFASWCTPCLAEHPLFMRLSAGGSVRIVGISYKDRPEDTSRWLARHAMRWGRRPSTGGCTACRKAICSMPKGASSTSMWGRSVTLIGAAPSNPNCVIWRG